MVINNLNSDFVILAAGVGVRMGSDIPKPLRKIGEKPLIEIAIQTAKNVQANNVTVVVSNNEVAGIVKEEGCNIVWQKELLGTADALKRVFEEGFIRSDNTIVTCVDIPFVKKETFSRLYDIHISDNNYITVLTTTIDNPEGYGRVIVDKEGNVKIVEESEASDEEKKEKVINSGIYCMKTGNTLDYLESVEKSEVKGEYYLTDIIKIANKNGEKIGLLETDYNEVQGINTINQLEKAQEVLLK